METRHPMQTLSLPGLENDSPTLIGEIVGVLFTSDETGFSIIKVAGTVVHGISTVRGNILKPRPGENVSAEGIWKDDSYYGRQFHASLIRRTPPSTPEGIIKYLGSGAIPGIGEKTARLIVGAFGVDTFSVIALTPERLKGIPGIGKAKISKIQQSVIDDLFEREVRVFLQSYGAGGGENRVARILRRYGAKSVDLIREDPYRLAREIEGIGFKTADKMAEALGVPRDGIQRARGAIHCGLIDAAKEGHSAQTEDELRARMAQECAECLDQFDKALTALESSEDVIRECVYGEATVYLPRYHRAEMRVKEAIAQLIFGAPNWCLEGIEAKIRSVCENTNFTPTAKQYEAVLAALTHRLSVISGPPGTGKTAALRIITAVLRSLGVRFHLCAPTGRAAKRAAIVTGVDASTVHRLLGLGGGGVTKKREELVTDLVIVDESSMLDISLAAQLFSALPATASLLLVGDANQLASVQPGLVFSHIIGAGVGKTVILDEIMRQAAQSRIISNAHRILNGQSPDLAQSENTDFYWIDQADPERIRDMIVQLLVDRIPQKFQFSALKDCQVLSPKHEGILGTKELNSFLQQTLNPPRAGLDEVKRSSCTFRSGDRVIQVKNSVEKGVMNGDVGLIEHINLSAKIACIQFEGVKVAYPLSDFDELSLAYCYTIHKAQGSEFPVAIIPVSTSFGYFFRRSLLYTALTRAKKLAILIGDRSALASAIAKTDDGRRFSGLLDRLRTVRQGDRATGITSESL